VSAPADTNRRAFLSATGRIALGALLAGGVGALASRDRRTCREPDLCRECAAFADCDLPAAVSARQTHIDPRRTGNPACPAAREER